MRDANDSSPDWRPSAPTATSGRELRDNFTTTEYQLNMDQPALGLGGLRCTNGQQHPPSASRRRRGGRGIAPHPSLELRGTEMTYSQKYHQLTAQRAYTRRVAAGGVRALLAPYSLRVPTIPTQRRRVVDRERIGA